MLRGETKDHLLQAFLSASNVGWCIHFRLSYWWGPRSQIRSPASAADRRRGTSIERCDHLFFHARIKPEQNPRIESERGKSCRRTEDTLRTRADSQDRRHYLFFEQPSAVQPGCTIYKLFQYSVRVDAGTIEASVGFGRAYAGHCAESFHLLFRAAESDSDGPPHLRGRIGWGGAHVDPRIVRLFNFHRLRRLHVPARRAGRYSQPREAGRERTAPGSPWQSHGADGRHRLDSVRRHPGRVRGRRGPTGRPSNVA